MKVSKWLLLTCCFVMLSYMSLALTGCGDSEEVADGDNDNESATDGDDENTDGDVENTDGDLDDEVTETAEVEEEVVDPNPLPFEQAGPNAAPNPMEFGPFPVGVKTVEINYTYDAGNGKTEERTLVTEIWYPATQEFKDGPFEAVDLRAQAVTAPLSEAKREIIVNSTIQPIETKAVRDADLDKGHGPYPLIIFSHGCNGIRWQSVFYTIHLASHGYVVVSPDHQGNTLWQIISEGYEGQMLQYLAHRQADVPVLLDDIVARNKDEESFFYGSMDEDQIAISGHSLGGITSGFAMCKDERYKAVVYHSPVISVGQMVGSCLNMDTRVPTLTMGGTEDRTLPYCGQYCDYKNYITGPQPKYLYQLEKGGHFTFSDICQLDLTYLSDELGMGAAADDALTDGCHETENAPWQAAHQSINHYATAFFNLYLKGSTGSEAYLVEKSAAPFDNVGFHKGEVPDWREEGGCEECEAF